MNKSKKVIKPNVVGGGVAIPLGNNFYFMRGRKHEFGGIDVGPNNKNGLEVEDGEVMQMGNKNVKVYSSLPILNGKSPAELVIAGLNPDKVFNAQERFKDINKLNDDGTKKAKYGKKKKNKTDKAGSLNENTIIDINESDDKIVYDFSKNEDENNPFYLGDDTYNVGVLPEMNVKAKGPAQRAYRKYLQQQEQNEFNNYIRENSNKVAKPFQIAMLSGMALPVASGISAGASAIDTFLASKIPYYSLGKSVLESIGLGVDGYMVGKDLSDGTYKPVEDWKDGNYGSAILNAGTDALALIGGIDLLKNAGKTVGRIYNNSVRRPREIAKAIDEAVDNATATGSIVVGDDYFRNDFASGSAFRQTGPSEVESTKILGYSHRADESPIIDEVRRADEIKDKNKRVYFDADGNRKYKIGLHKAAGHDHGVLGYTKGRPFYGYDNVGGVILEIDGTGKYFRHGHHGRYSELMPFEDIPNKKPIALKRRNTWDLQQLPAEQIKQFNKIGENQYQYMGHIIPYKIEHVKRLGGVSRHFTINGNVVNKAGYVPSTGELPKANLGTVASIDRWVSREDKNGYVANNLKAGIQKQIDTYNASKEYRKSKSAEIKHKQSETPVKIEENKVKELDNIEVKNPSIIEKQDGTNVVVSPIKKSNTSKRKRLKYDKSNDPYINLSSAATPFRKTLSSLGDMTIKLEGNDVPISQVPTIALNAIERKLAFMSKDDEDVKSSGHKIIEPVHIDTLPLNNIVAPIDTQTIETPIVKEVEKYPSIITGDTIPYTKSKHLNHRRYYIPESIDISAIKGGYRNRGDYRDIETEGLVFPTMREFRRYGDISSEELSGVKPENWLALLGIDKDGNIKVGNVSDFGPDDVVSIVGYDRIQGINKNSDGSIKWAPRSDKWSDKYVFTETTAINPITGKTETGSINVGSSRANPKEDHYGFLNGGRVVIRAGNETRLISGSVRDIDKEIELMKKRNNVDEVEFFMLDNGTFNLGVRTKDKKITASDWKQYDYQNTAGGHGIYLKRLGGMSKRQKAEGGKNILNPRGLGIQASMVKMQADAWDKKYPGQYNPYAQQFIDEFGDPTVYGPIMSDNANARRLGIDRGYRGNRGLGWVMPELPNINLDSYFINQRDVIDGSDRNVSGSIGSGSVRGGYSASGARRPETKMEPTKLSAIQLKPKGVTVDPIKPPTQITIKTPEVETKTKGTWWKDNGSDLISGISKGGASLASYLINRDMLNDLKYIGQPIFTPAAKLKTKININPQIDAINRTIAARNANVSANTASSKVRNARMNNNYIDRLGYLSELYGMKENKETELINADKLNQQEITKGNIKEYNDWVEKKQNFDNTVREKQSENAVSFVSNLASGVDDILANRQKRKQFKQNVAAYMASHPNVSPELLESYGLDLGRLGLIKRTNSYKTRKK